MKDIAKQGTHISEENLIVGLNQKDLESLNYLYDHYSAALYGIVFRIVKNADVAEEVLQDVFLPLFISFDLVLSIA